MMRLFDALRLKPSSRPALVGAGGKTTALFQLGRQSLETMVGALGRPASAWVAASTHLALEQAQLADRQVILHSLDDVAAVDPLSLPGLILFTGPRVENDRLAGLPLPILDRLEALARAGGIFLAIEADGSRRLPLKAPAAHEPALPAWADPVIVVAGLSGLGAALDEAHVHRAERFGQLAGLAAGMELTPAALVAVLVHPQGGLKDMPPATRRVVLLNQADTPQRQSAAHSMVDHLLEVYQAVLIGALQPQGTPGEPVEAGILTAHEPIAGIVLAAGSATRMGQAKQLLLWHGQPLIWHVAKTALAAGLSPVVVVTGSAAEAVEAAVQGLPVQCVRNLEWAGGQSTSIRTGLQALPPQAGGAVFLLADQPQLPATLVRALLELHASTLSPLVAPLIQGQRGNPVLFDRQTFPELMALQGDTGGRALFSRYHPVWVPWLDPLASLDVDTPDDYQRLLEETS